MSLIDWLLGPFRASHSPDTADDAERPRVFKPTVQIKESDLAAERHVNDTEFVASGKVRLAFVYSEDASASRKAGQIADQVVRSLEPRVVDAIAARLCARRIAPEDVIAQARSALARTEGPDDAVEWVHEWATRALEAAEHLKLIADMSFSTSGVRQIAVERRRQVDEEGFCAGHDSRHTDGSLCEAAVAYLTGNPNRWPSSWAIKWYKPTTRLRDLTKAGALVAAEIDRLNAEEAGRC